MNKIIPINLTKKFMLAGRAIVTLKSVKSGKHFTYRIIKKKTDDIWFVSVLYSPSNKRYNYIGCLIGDTFHHTKNSRVAITTPSFQAFNWAWNHLDNPLLEVWHEGKCGRCGRSLTDPDSINSGFGPICKSLIN